MSLSLDKIFSEHYDIVFVAYLYLTSTGDFFAGGAEIHLRNITESIGSNKKILVLCKGDEDKVTEIDGITIAQLNAKNRSHYLRRFRKLIGRIDTAQVHFNYLDLQIFHRKKQGVVYSATFHGVGWDFPIESEYPSYVPADNLHKYGSLYVKCKAIYKQVNAIKRLDKILSVDTSLVRFSQQFMTSHRLKISTVYNFVDLQAFKSIGTKPNRFIILYPRNISYARGAQFLVPIATALKDRDINFEIQVLGAGIEEIGGNKYEKALKQEIRDNHLEDNFKFLGRVEHDKMPGYFNKASVVLIPTFFSEGTSLSCLEAMASKCPVVATNIGGLNDIVMDGYNGLLCSPDSRPITDAIVEIYHNKDLAKNLSEKAYEIIVANYSHKLWSKKINEFFS